MKNNNKNTKKYVTGVFALLFAFNIATAAVPGSISDSTGFAITASAAEYTYTKAPVWTWNAGNTAATAKFVSNEDPDVAKIVNATITYDNIIDYSRTKYGERKVTATVVFNGKIYSDTRMTANYSIPVYNDYYYRNYSYYNDYYNYYNYCNGYYNKYYYGDYYNYYNYYNGYYNNGYYVNYYGANGGFIPSAVADRPYTGYTQYADTSFIDTNRYALSGTLSAIEIGTYTYTVTPINNYTWADGTTGSKTVTWRITNNYRYGYYYRSVRNYIHMSDDAIKSGVMVSRLAASAGDQVTVNNVMNYRTVMVYNYYTGNLVAIIEPFSTSSFTMPAFGVGIAFADEIDQAASDSDGSVIYVFDSDKKVFNKITK